MYKGGTVKAFKDALEEMKCIYDYDEEKTNLTLFDERSYAPTVVGLSTVDEKTGIEIMMSKNMMENEHVW